ncbi:copper chaperone PCu(A)C [Pengzhenrongella frigida]|nr:copper chaperone PCu(A)C [Cellulomonas sp. HLT2-17]
MTTRTRTTVSPRPAHRLGAGLLGLGLALALAGCAGGTSTSDPAAVDRASGAPGASSGPPDEAAALSITDPWIKAADTGMTAAFGTVVNDSDVEVRIVSATTTASPRAELHEMATNDAGEMVMRPKEGGFTVAANGSHELAPGGDHVMIMGITTAVRPGDEVSVTLTAQDGSELTFTAPARTFEGGNETYEGDATSTPGAPGATPTPAAS